MRRSDAPSQAKRRGFQTPFKKPTQPPEGANEAVSERVHTPAGLAPPPTITVAVNTVRRVGLGKQGGFRKPALSTSDSTSTPSPKHPPSTVQKVADLDPTDTKDKEDAVHLPNRYFKVLW